MSNLSAKFDLYLKGDELIFNLLRENVPLFHSSCSTKYSQTNAKVWYSTWLCSLILLFVSVGFGKPKNFWFFGKGFLRIFGHFFDNVKEECARVRTLGSASVKQILKNHPKMAKDLKKIHVEFCVESIHGGPEDFLTLKYYSQKISKENSVKLTYFIWRVFWPGLF